MGDRSLSVDRKWTIRMLIQLNGHFGGSSSILSSQNAFQCSSVSVGEFGSLAEITLFAGGFSVLLEFRYGS